MLYEEMRDKQSGEVVRVYGIYPGEKSALIFFPNKYISQNNGWERVKLSRLVPIDFPLNNSKYICVQGFACYQML